MSVLYSLEDVLVELLPAAQELSDHLPAQSFPLQNEPGDAHRCVRHEAPLDQVLDPLLRLPAAETRHDSFFIAIGLLISLLVLFIRFNFGSVRHCRLVRTFRLQINEHV